MYILGISCYYHDSSAALLKDGVVVRAAQEERFTRKKHDTAFPQNAIEYCLEAENITIQDIDYIAFYEKPMLKLERILYQHLENFPWSLKTFLSAIPHWITMKLRVRKTLRKQLGYGGRVFFVPHHMSHAAGAFFGSSFTKAAIVTIDGVGEWTTTAIGLGEGTSIHLTHDIKFPSSLGLLYSAITAYLGFKVNNSEYKVMGLSAYGDTNPETNKYYSLLKKVVDVKEDGSFRLNMKYFVFDYSNKMPSRHLEKLLGGSIRRSKDPVSQRHKDIAAALQLLYEHIFFKILNHAYNVTGCDAIVVSGGCALNSVANGKILRKTSFKQFWGPPDPGDGGNSVGAASFVYHSILGHKRVPAFNTVYTGPSYSEREIVYFLKKNNIVFKEITDVTKLVQTTAKLLHHNMVVGWFQHGSEWGPRALGARSILANPCDSDAKNRLNLKVKHREKFRPFAPVVCSDDASTYFDCDEPIPEPTDFMLMVYPVREKFREKIPSVTHVDGSGRLQTIRRKQNPEYYDLIKEFGKLSGIPILINTSYNIRGEPIVNSPADAYRCMMGTGIDYLVIGKFLVARKDNSKDSWDGESTAKD